MCDCVVVNRILFERRPHPNPRPDGHPRWVALQRRTGVVWLPLRPGLAKRAALVLLEKWAQEVNWGTPATGRKPSPGFPPGNATSSGCRPTSLHSINGALAIYCLTPQCGPVIKRHILNCNVNSRAAPVTSPASATPTPSALADGEHPQGT